MIVYIFYKTGQCHDLSQNTGMFAHVRYLFELVFIKQLFSFLRVEKVEVFFVIFGKRAE